MTQEEKLLIKDLCSRLPHNVICKLSVKGADVSITEKLDLGGLEHFMLGTMDVKPYFRPMSSMTEEELKELNEKYGNIAYFFIQEPPYYHGLQAQHSDIGSIEVSEFSEIYDWLNSHHFDYRCLIEKGLALEAPKDMYKTE
jgi:hypothetical protein